MIRSDKARRLQGLIGALSLALVALPISTAGAAPKPPSTNQMAKQLKALKSKNAQLTALLTDLQAKASALEARESTAASLSGPAAGDLTSNYPNPQLRPGTIVGSDVAEGSILGRNFAPGALSGRHVIDASIGPADIIDDSVGQAELLAGAVGASQLGEIVVTRKTGQPGLFREPNPFTLRVSCPNGTRLLGGGAAIERGLPREVANPVEIDSAFITKSVPSESEPTRTWEVTIKVDGIERFDVYTARAYCLSDQ